MKTAVNAVSGRNDSDPFAQKDGSLIKIDKHVPLPNRIDLHTHSCLEIGYCLSGKGRFYFSNKTYEVHPGDLFVVNHLEHHIAQADSEDPCVFLFLFFDYALLTDHTRLLAPFLYRTQAFRNKIDAADPISPVISALMQTIYEEFQAEKEERQALAKGVLLQILVLLFRHYAVSFEGREEQVLQNSALLQPAIAYMETHFREPLQFADIASLLSLSPSSVRHLFNRTYGFGFQEYLNQLRINEAKRLLLTTDMTVLDAGLQSGFQSLASFYRCFAAAVGCSPNHYRKLYR